MGGGVGCEVAEEAYARRAAWRWLTARATCLHVRSMVVCTSRLEYGMRVACRCLTQREVLQCQVGDEALALRYCTFCFWMDRLPRPHITSPSQIHESASRRLYLKQFKSRYSIPRRAHKACLFQDLCLIGTIWIRPSAHKDC